MRNLHPEMGAMTIHPTLERLRTVLLGTVMVLMPLWPDALPIPIGLLLLSMLPWREGWRGWTTPGWSDPLWWMAPWYLWHAVGLFWSDNQPHGLFDLEVKLMALLVPLLVAWNSAAWGRNRALIIRVFILATAATLLLFMLRSSWLFVAELQQRAAGEVPPGLPYTNIFFSSYYSPWLHPSYLAMYGVFALALHVLMPAGGERSSPGRMVLRSLIPVTLVLGVLLCASKTGWLGLLMVLVQVLVLRWKEPAMRRAVLRVALFGALVFASLVVSFGTVRGKITDMWSAMRSTEANAGDSSSARMLVWRAANALIVEQPVLGTGTGDVKDELMRVYTERGYTYPLEKRLNAHSQFLQTAVALGVPAAIWLLLMLLVPLWYAVRTGRQELIAILILAFLNWSVESMLEVQAGVVFFVLFAAIFSDPPSDRYPT
jgi:hypothetical protein